MASHRHAGFGFYTPHCSQLRVCQPCFLKHVRPAPANKDIFTHVEEKHQACTCSNHAYLSPQPQSLTLIHVMGQNRLNKMNANYVKIVHDTSVLFSEVIRQLCVKNRPSQLHNGGTPILRFKPVANRLLAYIFNL